VYRERPSKAANFKHSITGVVLGIRKHRSILSRCRTRSHNFFATPNNGIVASFLSRRFGFTSSLVNFKKMSAESETAPAKAPSAELLVELHCEEKDDALAEVLLVVQTIKLMSSDFVLRG
jgi:hypothetical protein